LIQIIASFSVFLTYHKVV